MAFLEWLQQLPFSVWMNESSSLWAFPMFLFMHTLGMSVVAGGSAAIDFALLGLWPRGSLQSLRNVFPVLMCGFAVNAITGVSIFMKDAATYGINLDLYVKLLFVLAGLVLLVVIRRKVFDDPGRSTARRYPAAPERWRGHRSRAGRAPSLRGG